jgi:hypothetical protein
MYRGRGTAFHVPFYAVRSVVKKMTPEFDNDLYLLFNMAFEGLDKADLSPTPSGNNLEDIAHYFKKNGDKPQVALINTRSKIYPKALLLRKIVDGKAVLFAFWKRGSVCEGMVVSLDGVSVLNEFIWVRDAKTGKFKATLKPKLDNNQKKERQAMITRAAVSTVVVESLNRAEYRAKFGGDILKKLQKERITLLDDMKKRGLVPKDANDPGTRKTAPISAASMLAKSMSASDEKQSGFIAVQKDGVMTFTTQVTDAERMGSKLARELEREAMLADREEERLNNT